ncbi:Hypothetical predicted protein [Octopus vulgaris]|uniref:Uncharacterized protein n=1 Tax=Octopus vulgaris TaxID=6645 RepID=A0AA36BHP6_OCTVU|nr:Hypothetical predicted protein [Octopus vulgaris]
MNFRKCLSICSSQTVLTNHLDYEHLDPSSLRSTNKNTGDLPQSGKSLTVASKFYNSNLRFKPHAYTKEGKAHVIDINLSKTIY